jgi:hypothetical protein
MPLLSLWSSNPNAILQLSIERVVGNAGDGDLKDDSECCRELRKYLAQMLTEKLAEYIDQCLTMPFEDSGLVLQDLINELGSRLDYVVTNGRYKGTAKTIGNDGLWIAEGHTIVVEVKTSDTYRISLDTIVGYREKLYAANQLSHPSSVLIVVGRQDTGELEAQIRGSRHAWDIRLISADALIRLVKLKEDAQDPETGNKIRSLLIPREYTRLDGMIDVMFTTAKDVESATEAEAGKDEPPTDADAPKARGNYQFTDSAVLQAKRDSIIAAVGRRDGVGLIKKSRALYWNPSHDVRAVVAVSKRYDRQTPYWYGYHVRWDEFLAEGKQSHFILGCMDRDVAYALPLDFMRSLVVDLDMTDRGNNDRYWHVHLTELPNGEVAILRPKVKSSLPLSAYALELDLGRKVKVSKGNSKR